MAPLISNPIIKILNSTVLKQWLKVEFRMLKDSPISACHRLQTVVLDISSFKAPRLSRTGKPKVYSAHNYSQIITT
jgi:hypothetical protein